MDELERIAYGCVMGSFAGTSVPGWTLDRLAAGMGSVGLFGSNVASLTQVSRLTATLRAARLDVLVATDEEGGDVTRLHAREGSPSPGNAALGAVDAVDLTEAVAAEIGEELASVGVDVDLAPVADVNSNPDNPVIGVRSFGGSPDLVARHTRAWVRGVQSAGVAACVKHFPGHGATDVDSHLGQPSVDAPLDVLRSRELVPFVAAVEAGAVAVMTSHVLLPAIDPLAPATLSPTVLRLLRDELGFDGLLVSDAVDMAGASAGRGVPDAAVAALAAGCDLVCLGADKSADDVDRVVRAVVQAVLDDELAEERLAEASGRVLAAARRVRSWRGRSATERPDATRPGPGGAGARTVAWRALAVDGELPVVRDAAVLRFRTRPNNAVGPVPWGLPADGLVLGGRDHLDVTRQTDVEELLRRAAGAGRPVVALVRDAHRHAWVGTRLAELASRCPTLVTVEMGWPGSSRLPGAATVWTHGASRASGAALDGLLARSAGPGSDRAAGQLRDEP